MSETQYRRKGNRLAVVGELTIYQSANFKSAVFELLDAADAPEVDLGEVSEFDSAGYQILALVRREAELRQKSLSLRECSDPVRRVLELYRATDWLKPKRARRARRAATKEATRSHG